VVGGLAVAGIALRAGGSHDATEDPHAGTVLDTFHEKGRSQQVVLGAQLLGGRRFSNEHAALVAARGRPGPMHGVLETVDRADGNPTPSFTVWNISNNAVEGVRRDGADGLGWATTVNAPDGPPYDHTYGVDVQQGAHVYTGNPYSDDPGGDDPMIGARSRID
jgi:hypothetical protein